MRSDPAHVGDLLLDALAERIAERIGERIDIALEHRPAIERVTLSVVETAEAIGVSISTVEGLIRAGKLASITIGTRRLIPMDEVRRVASHGVVADSEAAS